MLDPVLRLLARLRLPGAAAALLRLVVALRPSHARALTELQAIALARGDGAQAIALGERLVALDPDHRGALRNLAVLHLRAGDLDAALAPFARVDALDGAPPGATRLLADADMDPAAAARGEPYVAALDDVLVDTDYWFVGNGERLYAREVHGRTVANHPAVRGRVSPDGRRVIVTWAAPARTIEAPCVLLGGDDNYSHWITRNLIKLSLVEARPELAALPLVVHEDLRAYQREYLALLGIDETRLLRVPRPAVVAFRRLYVPTQLRNHPCMRGGIDWLRVRLARCMHPGEPRDLVYVSRRESPVRKLLNDAELAAALKRLGFRIIVPGTMSVAAQIAAFSRARVVVAAHGAGLANLVYSRPGARVVEIASAIIAHMDDFRVIARVMGQHVTTLVSDDLGPAGAADEHPMHRHYRCDVAAVLATVRRELAAAGAA
ncbi:MAG: glycosyltransferase 61 family protein [Burkholderiales bacterium]|nr:glycosyltransferase 61 family protein [Burkholderiales bacterium]